MKRKLSRKSICLAATALVLAAGISVGGAAAYFTTYATAGGQVPISLHSTETNIIEEFKDWTKHVTIENTGDVDGYIRVKAFVGSEYMLSYPGVVDGTDAGWTLGEDGYLYYSEIVAPGETTGNVDIKITMADGTSPDDVENGKSFNVIVIQESTPVEYKEDGTKYANWDNVASSEEQILTPEEEGDE